MGKWAKKTLQKLDQKDEAKRDSAEGNTRIKAEAPLLWEKLKESLQEEVDDVRRARPGVIGALVNKSDNELQVETDNFRLDVAFNADVPFVVYGAIKREDAYSKPRKALPTDRLELTLSSSGVWFRGRDGRLLSASEAAEVLLDTLQIG